MSGLKLDAIARGEETDRRAFGRKALHELHGWDAAGIEIQKHQPEMLLFHQIQSVFAAIHRPGLVALEIQE
jgi:hypothetical protein